MSTSLIALLSGPDRTGLVARAGTWIWQSGGNILHASQHHDHEENIFFQRLEWTPAPGHDPAAEAAAFSRFAAEELAMRQVRVALSTDRPRFALLVSRLSHCFHDILLRWREGELRGDPACVISNHPDLAPEAARYGLPFHHIPVDPAAKPAAEQALVAHLQASGIELVLLARYMQILSPAFFAAYPHPVINIHHSFLPAFAGARPYHQAYARGVKVIGATAHYATAELDSGPIICQEIARVNHRHGIPDLVQKGRDLERIAFAQAVRLHLENRILVYANKTVVFD